MIEAPFIGTESSLSNWVGPYVTNMLGRGEALADTPYTAYEGPLSAGPSSLQDKAFQGIAGLSMPSYGSFTDQGVADKFMSPYISAALEPQIAEARRQAEINRVQNAGRLTRAGAFGGSRQAIMESEGDRNLTRNLADITGKGYQSAYEQARDQFNTEQNRGLEGLDLQLRAGDTQRDIESEGIAADIKQFEQERDYPYRQVQFMQSLLQGLPLGTQSYQYQMPSDTAQTVGNVTDTADALPDIFGGLEGLWDLYKDWDW